METTWIFRPLKLHWKKYVEQRGFFVQRNNTDKSTQKQRGFFHHQNYIEKNMWKQRGFFDQRNYVRKSTWNDVDFSTSENTPITIKITSKRYAEMTWKFFQIWFSTYPRNIHVESTWIRCGVLVGSTWIVIINILINVIHHIWTLNKCVWII